MIERIKIKFLLWLMTWAGSKLWPYATVFTNTEDEVLAMHFARDETSLMRSMTIYLDGMKEEQDVSLN